MERVAVSKGGMVVAAHPLAVEAGVGVLRDGGNAVDAAIATSLCLGVVEPFASGLGGGGFMLICPPGGVERCVILDSRGKTPRRLTRERIYPGGRAIPWTPKVGVMSAAVPGLGRALDRALREYGSLPLSRLAAPAIEAAERGFEVDETFRHCSRLFEGAMRVDEDLCRIFMKKGRILEPGERLVQPELGATLRRIAEAGFEDLYAGEIARSILSTVNRTGELWGEDDLREADVRVREPLRTRVDGWELLCTPPPSRGGAGVIRIVHRWFRAGKPAEDAEWIEFHAAVLPETFRALDGIVGDPEVAPIGPGGLAGGTIEAGSGSTTHLTIVDGRGMIVSCSQTIGHFFGAGIVVRGRGIVLNNDLADMSNRPDHINSIDGGKRSVANMNPMVIARDGRPRFALGTPGSLRITGTLSQVTLRLIGLGMPLEQAVRAPRVHGDGGPTHIEGGFAPGAVARARLSGPVIEHPPNDLFFGGVHAVALREDGVRIGVADPRRSGMACGT